MQRIQTGRDLHGLHFIDRFPIREDNARFFKRRTTVRKGIFYDQILADFRVDERCGIGVLGSDDDIHFADFLLQQRLLHLFRRTRRNFVDHGQREGD
ncbi:hypothetical protein D3C71_1609870 [compost metagenome]